MNAHQHKFLCFDSRKKEGYTRRRYRCECGATKTGIEVIIDDDDELSAGSNGYLMAGIARKIKDATNSATLSVKYKNVPQKLREAIIYASIF